MTTAIGIIPTFTQATLKQLLHHSPELPKNGPVVLLIVAALQDEDTAQWFYPIQISNYSGLGGSTVRAVMVELTQLGYLERTKGVGGIHLYRLGPKITQR